MLRFKNLVLSVVIVFVTAGLSIAQEAPIRDPWDGYGLGSWVEIKETRTQIKDGETESKVLTTRYRIEDVGRSISVREENEDGISSSMHIDGGVPDELGLVIEDERTEELELDGETFSARVITYVSNPDDPRLELLSKPLPEILKSGGVEGERSMTVRIVMWVIEGLDIPYRELSMSGADLALGPEVVKVKFDVLRMSETGEVISRRSGEKSVTSLKAEKKIGDKTVVCVEEKIKESTEKPGEGEELHSRTSEGTTWLSNGIPGRVAGSTIGGSDHKGSGSYTREVLSFHALPPDEDLELKSVPDMKDRPLIPGDGWAGLHLGGWTASLTMNIREEKGTYAFGSIARVVAIREDGSYIVERRSFDGNAEFKEPSYSVIEPRKDPAGGTLSEEDPLGTGEEKLTLACGEFQSEWKSWGGWGTKSDFMKDKPLYGRMIWHPKEGGEDFSVLPFDGAIQAITYRKSWDSYSCHQEAKLARLMERDLEISFGEKKVPCISVFDYETQGDENGYKYNRWEINYYSPDAPGGNPFTVYNSVENKLITFSIKIGWGEFEDPCPSDQESVVNVIRTVNPTIQAGIQKLRDWIADENLTTVMKKDKSKLEAMLLEQIEKQEEDSASENDPADEVDK